MNAIENTNVEQSTSPTRKLVIATVTLAVSWLSVNAIWGLTSDDQTLLSSLLAEVMPLQFWLALGLFVTLAAASYGSYSRSLASQAFAFMLFSYLVGVSASRYAYLWIDPRGGVPFESYSDTIFALWERSFLLWPALPMLLVYAMYLRRSVPSPLRFGSWKVQSHSNDNTGNENWFARLGGFILCIVLPLGVFLQFTVGFGPAKTGSMFVFIVPLAILALFNGFTEELLFRGFLQSAFTKYVGSGAGIIAQGLFFGFHHWGASPDLIAGLPTAIVLCGLGIYWGYSVRATGGIGWAVCTHALVDLAFFSAHFVRGE